MKSIKEIPISVILVLIGMFLLGLRTGAKLKEWTPEARIDTVYVARDLSEWELLELAIIQTESKFNPQAVGRSDDRGIFQATPIWVAEVNRIIKLKKLETEPYSHADAFDIQKSLEMFNIIQDYHNPDHSFDRAIQLHNPGGDSIGYSNRVKQNYKILVRQEEVRKALFL